MPAVTVPDNLVLPRITPPADRSAVRPVKTVTDAPAGFEGEGFPVRRAFAGVPLADLDPFIHMDQMGEVEYAPGGLFHGIQLWVNLPAVDKWINPRYQNIEGSNVLLLTTPDGGSLVRVIA